MIFFAHAGESHDTTAESAWHVLQNPLVSLPLLIGLILLLAVVSWKLTAKSLDKTLLICCSVLLVVGFSSYSISSVLSVVSISVGIVGCMAAVLISLSNEGG